MLPSFFFRPEAAPGVLQQPGRSFVPACAICHWEIGTGGLQIPRLSVGTAARPKVQVGTPASAM